MVLLAVMITAVTVNGQTLRETLYSGKLKTDSGTVIRKGDDLSTMIDTVKKKPVEVEKPKSVLAETNTPANTDSIPIQSVAAAATKDNNAIWKAYIDEFTGILRTEVLPSKKIKDGAYLILIDYEIGVDGQIAVNSVTSSPESSFLEQQVKERLILTAPQMTPLLTATGKPRKAGKKQMINLAK
jgi:hypothetical protein